MAWLAMSLDWFKGKFTGKPHDLHGKIDGSRCRFSQENQSIDIGKLTAASMEHQHLQWVNQL